METCSNCGATLRPGARFCTTCGTRLNAAPTANSGWGEPRTPEPDTQQTAVYQPIQEEAAPETLSVRGRTRDWGGSTSADANDPAGRFISALDNAVKPEPVDEPAPATLPAENTWVTPAPDAIAPSTWGSATTSSSFDTWRAPTAWTPPAAAADEPATDEEPTPAEAADEPEAVATATVEAPELTEVEPAVEESTPAETMSSAEDAATEQHADSDDHPVEDLTPADARARAIALVEELRGVLRQVPAGGEADDTTAINTLTSASLAAGNFDDVREVISTVQEDPRDIHALAALAAKVDRIEALLDDQAALRAAIDGAIGMLHTK